MYSANFLNILFLLVLFFTQQGCTTDNINNTSKISYPYAASPQSKKEMIERLPKVKTGMLSDEVVKIMGAPDKVNNIYLRIKNGKETGFSYVYLLQRKKENGSINEKDEQLIRFIFGTDKKLIRIDRW